MDTTDDSGIEQHDSSNVLDKGQTKLEKEALVFQINKIVSSGVIERDASVEEPLTELFPPFILAICTSPEPDTHFGVGDLQEALNYLKSRIVKQIIEIVRSDVLDNLKIPEMPEAVLIEKPADVIIDMLRTYRGILRRINGEESLPFRPDPEQLGPFAEAA